MVVILAQTERLVAPKIAFSRYSPNGIWNNNGVYLVACSGLHACQSCCAVKVKQPHLGRAGFKLFLIIWFSPGV